jgi:hypothetical protein
MIGILIIKMISLIWKYKSDLKCCLFAEFTMLICLLGLRFAIAKLRLRLFRVPIITAIVITGLPAVAFSSCVLAWSHKKMLWEKKRHVLEQLFSNQKVVTE